MRTQQKHKMRWMFWFSIGNKIPLDSPYDAEMLLEVAPFAGLPVEAFYKLIRLDCHGMRTVLFGFLVDEGTGLDLLGESFTYDVISDDVLPD